jgi:outer membrane protein assembly factor BamB
VSHDHHFFLVLDDVNAFQPLVYVGSEDNNLYAVGILYGDLRWKFTTKGKILSTATFSPDGERLYFGSNDGNVYAVAASSGKLFWSVQTEGGVVASPLVSKTGTIYVGSHDGYLYALDSAANGTTVWRKYLGGPIFCKVAIGEEKGAIYAGTSADKGARIFGLDAKTGDVLWEFAKAGKVMSSPALSADGKVGTVSRERQVENDTEVRRKFVYTTD